MLTNTEIKKQLETGNIQITNLKDHSLDKPNSCLVSIEDYLYTFDYRIIDTKDKDKYMKEISTGAVDTLKKIKIDKKGTLLEPHKVYITKTSEKITTNGYVPVLNGRTSLSLLGVSIELNNGFWTQHHSGQLLITIVCTKPTIIYPNIEIGNLTFFESTNFQSKTNGMLSGREIERQMKLGNIIITPKDNILINPNSVNLSLNNTLGYYTEPIIDLKKENKIETIKFDENGIILSPNHTYVTRTNEWTETKEHIPMLSGRSSLGRLGYHAHCSGGMGSIGYKGYFHMGLRVTTPIKIYPNMKCAQIYYFKPVGETITKYNGSMQNLSAEQLGSSYHKKLIKK